MVGGSCTILGVIGTPVRRGVPGRRRRRGLCAAALATLAAAVACADDPGERLPDAGASRDAAPDGVADAAPGLDVDARPDRFTPGPDAAAQVEPPLVVRTCAAGSADGCCPSVLDFEEGTTEHFLPAACCRLALSSPQLAATPTACGHGALMLNADFRATDASSMCGTTTEAPDCAFTAGEVTRAVLAPLSLTGRTATVMAYLQGPALPAAPVHGRLFVVGQAGRVEGPERQLGVLETWTPLELTLADDGSGAGADIQILGIRIDFHGQAWSGRLFLDELTWR